MASSLSRSGLGMALSGLLLLGTAGGAAAVPEISKLGPLLTFEGSCDASAAVLLEGTGVLVGSDWDNLLRVYPLEGGAPKATIDAYAVSEVPRHARRNRSAIEGAARLGERIYWIGSHARDTKRGKTDMNRRRLFSLALQRTPAGEQAVPVDGAYSELLQDLSTSPSLQRPPLASSIHYELPLVPHLVPGKAGLNIEGLAAARDGQTLLLGLRNPRRGKYALIVPLANPRSLVQHRGPAELGEPWQLDTAGLGIVSLEYAPVHDAYFVLVARHDAEADFSLLHWTGDPAAAPTPLELSLPDGLMPQAMAISADGSRLLLLSDDGETRRPVADQSGCGGLLDAQGRCECMRLKDHSKRSFRGVWLDLERPRYRFRQP